MKLFASIATTIIISGSVWGLVMAQPKVTEIDNKLSESRDTKIAATVIDKRPKDYLQGITRTISLEGVPQLWDKFYAKYDTNNPLPESVDRIIVLYQEFNKDYSEATVTVGYETAKTAIASSLKKLPDISDAKLLLKQGKHTENELTEAWKQINFAKQPFAVVEIHEINQHGLPESSQMSVYYKQ